jgi:hypothetical protein
MERIRVERKPVRRRPRPEVLPLDPHDPDIVRAKALIAKKPQPPRERAA